MLLSVSKGMGLYLCIAQVDLKENSSVCSLCINDIYDVALIWCWYKLLCMMMTTFVMMLYEVKALIMVPLVVYLVYMELWGTHTHCTSGLGFGVMSKVVWCIDQMDSKNEQVIMALVWCYSWTWTWICLIVVMVWTCICSLNVNKGF